MPQKFTVKECFEKLTNGDVVGEVEGTLQRVLKPMENEHGTLQNADIIGDDGYVGRITFADNPQNHETSNGKRIKLKSTESQKHGWLGVKMKKGPKGMAIWVTSTAEVTYPGGGGEASASKPKTETKPYGVPQSHPPEVAQPPPVIKPARWHVENLADLFATCVALVNEKVMPVALQGNETADASLEIAQAYATSLFIQCDRQGLTRAWDKDALPPPVVPPPERWREAIIGKGEYKGKPLSELPRAQLQVLFDYYDGKGANTPFAECVYAAVEEYRAKERATQSTKPGYDPAIDPNPDGDDIPF